MSGTQFPFFSGGMPLIPPRLTGLDGIGVLSGNKVFLDSGQARSWWYDAAAGLTRFTAGATNVLAISDAGTVSFTGGNASIAVGGSITASTGTFTAVSTGNSGTINKATATGALQYAISATANLTGAATGKNAYLSYMTVPSDTMSTAGATLGSTGGMLALNGSFGGAGALGTRSGLMVSYSMQGINAAGVNTIGISSWLFSSFNAGGTDTNSGSKGLLYGLNPQILLQNGATNYQLVNGLGEIDLAVQTGASVRDKMFGSFVHLNTDAVQGASLDAFLMFGAQQGFSAGTKLGLSIGSHDGPWPMDPMGTWTGATQQLFAGSADRTAFLPPRKLFAGTDYFDIDFTLSSGFAFRSVGFSVDGIGQISISNAKIATISAGISISVPNQRATGATIAAGGGGGGSGLNDYYVNDILSDIYGGRYLVTAIAAGAVTAITVLNFAVVNASPSNPVATYGASGTGCTLNLAWSTAALVDIKGVSSTALAASTSYATDALAAVGGVAIGQFYRNGSIVQVRVT